MTSKAVCADLARRRRGGALIDEIVTHLSRALFMSTYSSSKKKLTMGRHTGKHG